MDKKEIVTEVGVIIGRFQSPILHEAHKELISWVCSRHPKVLIFLGMTPLKGSFCNPLDFETRKQMILAEYPSVNVFYIKDVPSDNVWSKNLDSSIYDVITPNQKVTLYGSRDSFILYYTGKFPTVELTSTNQISATEVRNKTAAQSVDSPEFRAGIVWAAYNRYPTVISTVDIAIFNHDFSELLLGRKAGETKFRFIGGFSDVSSDSFEQDARREVQEETGLSITDPQYVGSFPIDDWRFRKEKDKIRTTLFIAQKEFGVEKANDDIVEIKWFNFKNINDSDLVPHHTILLNAIKNKLK